MIKKIFALMTGVLFVYGCSTTHLNRSASTPEIRPEAQTDSHLQSTNKVLFTTLSRKDFAKIIRRPKVQLLDVRTADEHTAGCIPGSLNIDILQETTFLHRADSLLDKKRPVALYCRSGKRSKTAATLLSKAGYRVFELEGGYNAWTENEQK